jgi:hypothetical protein
MTLFFASDIRAQRSSSARPVKVRRPQYRVRLVEDGERCLITVLDISLDG